MQIAAMLYCRGCINDNVDASTEDGKTLFYDSCLEEDKVSIAVY